MSYAGNGQTSFARTRGYKVLAIIGAIAVAGFIFANFAGSTQTYVAEATERIVTVDKSAEQYAVKIDALKDEVVAELEKCESGGYSADRGIIVFDTNNKASIGVLQMQKDHVIHFQKKLYGKDVTGQEAVVIAIVPETARPLAKRVLFEIEDGWKEWFNCGRKLNLATKIEYIKKLETAHIAN